MKTWLGLIAASVGVFLFILISFGRIAGENGEEGGVRWIHDPNELFVYFDRSSWWEVGGVPYTWSAPQEYPQLAVLLLTLPKMLGGQSTSEYVAGFYFLNFFFLAFVLWLAYRIQIVFGRNPWRTALWLLPSMLYFSFNRFDLWMMALVLASLLALWKRWDSTAFLLLALATLIKWVPVLLLPLFLLWLQKEHRCWRWPLLFFMLGLAPFLLWTLWQAGFDALWFSLGFHLGRDVGDGSLNQVISHLLNVEFGSKLESVVLRGFWVVQLLLPFLALIVWMFPRLRLRRFFDGYITYSKKTFFLASALSLTLFSFFNRFYSPQWWLWSAALLLPLLKQKKEFALFLLLDLVHYFIFPVAFDVWGSDHSFSILLHGIRIFLMTYLFVTLLRRLVFVKKTSSQPQARLVSTVPDA